MKTIRIRALGLSLCLLAAALCLPFPSLAADTTYHYGVPDTDDASLQLSPPAVFNKQGLNNFYAYYSMQNDSAGKVPQASLKECEYAVNRDSYFMKTMVPPKSVVDNYIDKIWPTLYPNENYQFWWKIDSYGVVAPAGNMVAVVGFKAPAAGTYVIDAQCYGGAKKDQGNISDKADGVSFAEMYKDTALWAQASGRDYKDASGAWKLPQQTLTMAQGELVWFASDPNKTFENDIGHI